jgi:phage terminase small subunit
MAKSKLTPKQEAFALAYVETGNASEAYRRSYNIKSSTPQAVWVSACRVLADAKVSLRVAQLQERAVKRHDVTIDSLTQELDEDRELARRLGMPSSAISAVMGKAKLHGLAADRQLVGGDPNAPPIAVAITVNFKSASQS